MMDERMIELAKAKWRTKEICDTAADCGRCPLCFPDGRCLCVDKDALAEAEKMCGADEIEPKPGFTPAEKRKRVLDEAIDAVCRDRCEMYGEVEDNFGVIAELWNAYIRAGMPEGACVVDLGARQVADMMILFKLGRVATAMEDHRDTYVDIAGYAACAGGMCTDA